MWLREVCNDPYTARSVDTTCALTAETANDVVGPRCRYAFPDALDADSVFLPLLRVCNFSMATAPCGDEVPEGSNAESVMDFICSGLSRITDTFSCCYNSLYNDTEFLVFLVQSGRIGEREVNSTLNFGMTPFWDTCGTNVPEMCSSAAFGAKAVAALGLLCAVLSIFTGL